MSEAVEKIGEWANRTQEYRPVAWDRLPEIYLYMDQVLTYMNKQLEQARSRKSSDNAS